MIENADHFVASIAELLTSIHNLATPEIAADTACGLLIR